MPRQFGPGSTKGRALGLLTNPRGDVLLNLRHDKPGVFHPGHWAIIGGGVEPGQELDEAFRREVTEEIGYELGVAQEALGQVVFSLRSP